jgi:transmembrane sensor
MRPPEGNSHARMAADLDAIETAAAEWLVERDAGFAPGRAENFAAWRAADPRHEAAFAEAESALAMILEDLPAVRAPLEARRKQGRVVRPVIFRAPVWAAGGLAAALAVFAGLWWLRPAPINATALQTFSAAGGPQQVALADGSTVNLNTASAVRVQLTPRERRIALDAGEAHFAVAHDQARPFIVTAAGVSVRAVGTAFNVRVVSDGVEVLVTEGRVTIERAESGAAVPTAFVSAAERILIPAIPASMLAPAVERVSADTIRDAIRWHRAVMTFSDVPLRDVIAQFNRRNAVQLSLGDAALGDRAIGGTFAVDQPEAFARLLAQDGDLVAERRGPSGIVLRRAP